MRTKKIIIFLVGLFVGVAAGVLGHQFVITMTAYAKVSQHSIQGRQILDRIGRYTEANGQAPDQDWFESLGDLTVTNEGHHWIYHTPPKRLNQGGELLISTATDYQNRYLGGFKDGSVFFSNLKK